MDIATQLIPPAVLVAVFIFMMRDLKSDLRQMSVKLDKLADDHRDLGRELSELKGGLFKVISSRT